MKKDKKIIGLILASELTYAKGKSLWLEEFVVTEQSQGKKYGTKLIKHLEHVAKKKKINMIYFNTKEFNSKFYTKLEFQKTDYFMMEKEI